MVTYIQHSVCTLKNASLTLPSVLKVLCTGIMILLVSPHSAYPLSGAEIAKELKNVPPQHYEIAQKVLGCAMQYPMKDLRQVASRVFKLRDDTLAMCANGQPKKAHIRVINEGRALMREPMVKAIRQCSMEVMDIFIFMKQVEKRPLGTLCPKRSAK